MNPTIKRIVKERAKEYSGTEHLFAQVAKASYIKGAEQNAPMIYAQGLNDAIEYIKRQPTMASAIAIQFGIEQHFESALEHLAKDKA